ncbi:hypothetical protein ACEWY4_024823 [Coilia grayii]|uniref:G-protein coupled receptors family 1 profile domain-containing protein n=1 Tax=Coilia grayii TaxID=363190 RepID=A0ABD1IVU8_9TELE
MNFTNSHFTPLNATIVFQPDFLFLLPGVCVGLPALCWAVRSQHLIQRGGGRVSTFIIFLIFSDAVEVLLTFLTAAAYFQIITDRHQIPIAFTLVSVRVCGFYLHQLVALEGILSLSNPLCFSRLSSPLVSIPLSITLWISAFTLDFPELATVLHSVVCGLMCFVTVALWVLALKAPRSSESSSHRDRKPALRVLAVAQFTLLFIHGPSALLFLAKTFDYYFKARKSVWQIIYFFTGLRLVADPLLCVLVHKERLRGQAPDLNTTPH